jgi:membrane-associated protein
MQFISDIVQLLVQHFGEVAVFILVFAETGLLIGIILPGDSLLFLTGVYAANGRLRLQVLLVVIIAAAILGDNFGYFIGKRTGPKVFSRSSGIFFNKGYIERANKFLLKYGDAAVFLARFIGYLRTFMPLVAGVGRMNHAKFFLYNVLGAVSWTISLVLVSYFLGERFPNMIQIADFVVLCIVTFSFIVGVAGILYGIYRRKYLVSIEK